MSEAKFLNGLIAKAPHEKAPDFVKCNLSIKRGELITTLSQMNYEWVNVQVKVSKQGKWYAQIDDWKPEKSSHQEAKSNGYQPQGGMPDDFDDDIPFMRPHDEYFG